MITAQVARDLPLTNKWLAKVKIDEETGCWNWTASKCRSGYGQMFAFGRRNRSHRVAYEHHHDCKIPDGMHVLHHCDNPACVNPKHLFLGTNADNVADKIAKGRQARETSGHKGVEHGCAKLTEPDVLVIRSSSGITNQMLADQFGVSNQQISRIRSGKAWSHLKDAVQ